MKHKYRELSLEELELVRGGFDYSGFYEYRAEILNKFKLKDKSNNYLYTKEEGMSYGWYQNSRRSD